MKKLYTIEEVRPKIFLVEFSNAYDLAMHFLRYQEFYECPSSKFRGKSFTILNYMKWYSKEYGKNNFTYPTDWVGFNIPSEIIDNVHYLGIKDFNEYDNELLKIYNFCANKANGPFYLIGSKKGDTITKGHEIAHGFFYTIPKYKKEMTKLVKALDPNLRKNMNSILKHIGYASKVYVDETQAYMATGLPYLGDIDISFETESKLMDSRKEFTQLFESYYYGK